MGRHGAGGAADACTAVSETADYGYPIHSHDATSIQLSFQESLTFLVYTSEAAVALTAPQKSAG